MTCEAASKLILTNKNKVQLINSVTGNIFIPSDDINDVFNIRQNIFDILQDRNFTVDERIKNLITTYNLKMTNKTLHEWREIYLQLEHLDESWCESIKNIGFCANSKPELLTTPEWQMGFEQLLVYFIYRHFADCQYDGLFHERLSFCILSYIIIKSICLSKDDSSIETLLDISRQYSSEIEYCEENIERLLNELQTKA